MGRMLIVGCSGSRWLAGKIAGELNADYTDLLTERFPDNETRVRFQKDLRNKKVVLMQSFYDNINDKILEALFAGHTAKELKAGVILVAPYLAYLREDKRFESGESINARIVAKLFRIFDKVFVVEPHLHRFKRLKDFFPNAKKVEVTGKIADYIRANIHGDYSIIGPDEESRQWVDKIACKLGKKSIVLKKKRLTPEKVKISKVKMNLKGKKAVIVDDIISTGGTMIETAKIAKACGAEKIYFICVHGIFAKNALARLKKFGNVISCNTIPSSVAKIDVSEAIADALRKC